MRHGPDVWVGNADILPPGIIIDLNWHMPTNQMLLDHNSVNQKALIMGLSVLCRGRFPRNDSQDKVSTAETKI